jgi:hypothetical protein
MQLLQTKHSHKRLAKRALNLSYLTKGWVYALTWHDNILKCTHNFIKYIDIKNNFLNKK